MPKSTLDSTADASATIRIKVRGQDGETVHFQIRRSSSIKKLLTAYCNDRDRDYDAVRFLIDGHRFGHYKTPEQLGLVDGDQIDAMLHMTGGGSRVTICKGKAFSL